MGLQQNTPEELLSATQMDVRKLVLRFRTLNSFLNGNK